MLRNSHRTHIGHDYGHAEWSQRSFAQDMMTIYNDPFSYSSFTTADADVDDNSVSLTAKVLDTVPSVLLSVSDWCDSTESNAIKSIQMIACIARPLSTAVSVLLFPPYTQRRNATIRAPVTFSSQGPSPLI